MADFTLSPLKESDRNAVIDLFNYYIETSFAAFPETRVPYAFYDLMMETTRGYPSAAVRDQDGVLAGFGMLRPHNPLPVFTRTAEVTYFIRPGDTGRGLGARVLRYLEEEGKKKGISCILAGISSQNEGSIRFHRNHGFSEVGRFREVGMKNGILFDVVWMEKLI